jgi:phage/plasmid primase, P4 family, C-terminal domain
MIIEDRNQEETGSNNRIAISNPNTKSSYPLGKIESIDNRCSWLRHCKRDCNILSELELYYCLTVINTCVNAEENAIEYSENHQNYSKEMILKKLKYINEKGYCPVSCSKIRSTFGSYCEGCNLGVGSPATLGRKKTREELEAVGFIFDDKGRIVGLNYNKFSAYLNSRLEILYTDAGRFYMHSDNYWKYVDWNLLSRICRDILHEFKPNFWTEAHEGGYVGALKREVLRIPKLDSDRTKINMVNGIFDLNAYSIMPHTPSIRSGYQLPIDHNIDAKCHTFKTFLGDILGGDKELIKVVQEMFGYCLTAETSAQKAFILYGRGSNGKSLLAEVLMNLVGKSNTSAVPLNELDNPFARYELVDKLLNLATENEISERGLNTTFFKSIVSGDAIQVEKKFEQSFMYQPFCKLVFCLNNLPYSKDKSWGFQRRLVVIPFNKVFREDDPDTKNYAELRDILLSELDGIFIWALEGLKRLRENKFKFSKSEAVNGALEDYKTEVNPYYNFVKEKLEQGDEQDMIANETLSNLFREWATKNGHKNLAGASNQKIVREVRHSLLDIKMEINYGEKVKSGGKRCTQKVRLKKGEHVNAEKVA